MQYTCRRHRVLYTIIRIFPVKCYYLLSPMIRDNFATSHSGRMALGPAHRQRLVGKSATLSINVNVYAEHRPPPLPTPMLANDVDRNFGNIVVYVFI